MSSSLSPFPALQEKSGNAGPSRISSAGYINQNIGDFFTVNEDLFRKAIRVDAGVSELQSILTSFLNSGKATWAGNLAELGYADSDSPAEIMIYPEDFIAKNTIAGLITDYNEDRKNSGEKDKVITYSDVVATMMQSVTDIINSVSRILMAFVSISLVVSSIMIGVITYISVLERRKVLLCRFAKHLHAVQHVHKTRHAVIYDLAVFQILFRDEF